MQFLQFIIKMIEFCDKNKKSLPVKVRSNCRKIKNTTCVRISVTDIISLIFRKLREETLCSYYDGNQGCWPMPDFHVLYCITKLSICKLSKVTFFSIKVWLKLHDIKNKHKKANNFVHFDKFQIPKNRK